MFRNLLQMNIQIDKNPAFIFFLTFILLFIPFFEANSFSKNDSKLNIVVIDPGHGGRDPGANTSGVDEKDIVLSIALKVGNYIKNNFPDVKVIYTRSSDVFIPLNRRAEIANKNKADLFISIHANSLKSTAFSGTETFVLGHHRSQDNLDVAKKENSVILLEEDYTTTYERFDPNSSESYIMFEFLRNEYFDQSVDFAGLVQSQFREKAKRKDRGVKQAGFLVLRETAMPSVLVEVGYITNKSERDYMSSETGKTNLASSIYRAFRDYKIRFESKSNFGLTTQNNPDINKSEVNNPVVKTPVSNNSIKPNQNSINTKQKNNSVEKPDDKISSPISTNIQQPVKKPQQDKKSGAIALNTKENKIKTSLTPTPETKTTQASKKQSIKVASKIKTQEKADIKTNKESTIEKPKQSVLKSKKRTPSTPALKTPDKKSPIPINSKTKPEIIFSIQVAVTTKLVKTDPANFKGQEGIFHKIVDNRNKYFYGKFDNYTSAHKALITIRSKFHDAFMVAFENNKSISLAEARLKLSNKP